MNDQHPTGGPTTKYAATYPRIYFAHPVVSYDTPLEEETIAYVRRYLGSECVIVNPNSDEHHRAYAATKSMDYFVKLAESCEVCVFLSFSDGYIGAGVAKEVDSFFARFGLEAKVFEYERIGKLLVARRHSCLASRVLSVGETRDRIPRFFGSYTT